MIAKLLVSIARFVVPEFLGTYSVSARRVIGGRWSRTAKGSVFGREVTLWERFDVCPGKGNAAFVLGSDSWSMPDELPDLCCFDDTAFVVSSPSEGIVYGSASVCNCEVWQ